MAHYCHAEGCDVEVPPRLLMCRDHWYSLPKRIRDAVWREYRPGQEIDKNPSRAYLAVMKEAIDYIGAKDLKTEEGRLW